MKHFYLVRHCKAEGQDPDAALTPLGCQQAAALAAFFTDIPIERIIASPYLRAQATAEPLARHFGLEIETDSLLKRESFPHIRCLTGTSACETRFLI